jgi:hypothetical protein
MEVPVLLAKAKKEAAASLTWETLPGAEANSALKTVWMESTTTN